MFLQLILLAFAASIDSLGIGFSYGIRKIKISILSIVIVSLISLSFSIVSLSLGNILSLIFSEKVTYFISILILILLGIFMIKKGLEPENKNIATINVKNTNISKNKTYSFFIKCLGITINIIKDPISSDLDNSLKIDYKEAFFLGIALSIDCIGICISVSHLNFYKYLLALFIMLFQITFLFFGKFLGKKANFKFLDKFNASAIAGVILIFIAFFKLMYN